MKHIFGQYQTRNAPVLLILLYLFIAELPCSSQFRVYTFRIVEAMIGPNDFLTISRN